MHLQIEKLLNLTCWGPTLLRLCYPCPLVPVSRSWLRSHRGRDPKKTWTLKQFIKLLTQSIDNQSSNYLLFCRCRRIVIVVPVVIPIILDAIRVDSWVLTQRRIHPRKGWLSRSRRGRGWNGRLLVTDYLKIDAIIIRNNLLINNNIIGWCLIVSLCIHE